MLGSVVRVANAYSSLHSLTLGVCVISTIVVSLWGRWAMFRLRKLGDGPAADTLLTKVGFAFRCLAFVPLLGLLVFVPPFLCSGANCQPADFANAGLTMSLLLGLLAAGTWVWFVFGRVFASAAPKVFLELTDRDKGVLLAAVGLAIAALLVMALSRPGAV